MTTPSTRDLDAHPNPRDTPPRTCIPAVTSPILDTHGRLPRLTLEVHVTSTENTATPTETEWKTARQYWIKARDDKDGDAVAVIAQALADQRAKYEAEIVEARARELMVAAEQWAADPDEVGDSFIDARNWLRDRADRIRKVAQQ